MKQDQSLAQWPAARKLCAPFLIMGVSLWMLTNVIDLSLLDALPATIAALPMGLLFLSGLLTALSFWAIARYDGIAHRHFATGMDPALAHKSGFAAIAIAQTVGFGVLSGAAVRWRMLPDLGLKTSLQLATFVSVTFLTAFAFLTAVVCLLLPTPAWITQPALLIAIGIPFSLLCLSFAPHCAPIRHRIRIPSLCASGTMLGWTALDVLAAALALYVLIPSETLSFATFLPIFMLAIGVAMLSGAPGGVGPFELTLISLLPQVPTAELIAAIIAFRAIYYAGPALVAVVVVFVTKRPEPAHETTVAPAHPIPAELGILAQNGGTILSHGTGCYGLWHTTQTATLLFDPVSGPEKPALHSLRTEARCSNRVPVIYKCSGRMALVARKEGWEVARIAQDCVLPLEEYDLSIPARRSLRRKLRQAEKAGVTITKATTLPLAEMAALDAAWQFAQGAARGATMGRFCPTYLSTQDVFLAHHQGKLIAYASFHADHGSLCLDLMRHGSDLPQGTMHMIIQTAIDAAKTTGKSQVSLAAIPSMPEWTKRTGPLRQKFTKSGLGQFKRSFAPRFVPKYAAAPTRAALALALADITAEVFWPQPLTSTDAPHKEDEDYELALNYVPWKGGAQPNFTGV